MALKLGMRQVRLRHVDSNETSYSALLVTGSTQMILQREIIFGGLHTASMSKCRSVIVIKITLGDAMFLVSISKAALHPIHFVI